MVEPQARTLVVAEPDIYGYPLLLAPPAAAAFLAMQAAAARDHITLQGVSGYRGFAGQLAILERRLQKGVPIMRALQINDLPGYSEHQSGCAIDLTTPGVAPVTAAFARTAAYHWLTQHAAQFGFHLSYGRYNRHGVEFEPWHWRFDPYAKASKNHGG